MSTLQSTLKLTLVDQVTGRARAIGGALNGIQRQVSTMGAMSRNLLAFGATYLGVREGLQSTVGAAISFESAFANVKKVVDASDQQLKAMEKNIRGLSTVLPIAANDLAGLYAAAAESGIATDELNKFALMASQVGIAFDIPAATAGEQLAKLKTQLGLTVAETGDLADVMNHLSNNMSSKAGDIQEFMLRVGAFAQMSGFAKEQTAALGSAMIAAGAEPETAGTAMQNVVKALTRGKFAKASQKKVAKALGLDLPAIARQMQKDAPGALRKVLGAIAKAPKDQQVALLSEFFGDEARAFAPLVGNLKLLDQAFGLVADSTKYAGSAYREYIARANTTANVLEILQGKFSEFGRSIGDGMLPGLKEFALGVGDILDTFDERGHIFDDAKWAMQGFLQGLGFDGGIRDAVNELGDFLFGPAEGPGKKRERIAAVFAQFREWGTDIKWFGEQVDEAVTKFEKAFKLKPGTIGDTLGEIGGWGLTLGISSVGIGLAATALSALATALYRLSGASLLIGGAKGIAKLFGVFASSGSVVNATSAGSKAAQLPKPGGLPMGTKFAAEWDKLGKFAKGFTVLQTISGLYDAVKNSTPEGMKDNINGTRSFADSMTRFLFGDEIADQSFAKDPVDAATLQDHPPGFQMLGELITILDQRLSATDPSVQARVAQQLAIQNSQFPGKTADDFDVGRKVVSIDSASISAMIQPSGTQSVRVENQQTPNVTVHASITVSGVSDPVAAANVAADRLGQKVKNTLEGTHTD